MGTPPPKRKVFKRTPTTPPVAQSGFKGDFTPEIKEIILNKSLSEEEKLKQLSEL